MNENNESYAEEMTRLRLAAVRSQIAANDSIATNNAAHSAALASTMAEHTSVQAFRAEILRHNEISSRHLKFVELEMRRHHYFVEHMLALIAGNTLKNSTENEDKNIARATSVATTITGVYYSDDDHAEITKAMQP